MIRNIIIVAIGGATGSVLRYLISVLTGKTYATTFPLATFIVNMAGCLLIGLLIGLISKNSISNPELRLLLMTGFCGGFTTFSAFAQENIFLMQSNHTTTAFVYTLLSIVAGLTLVWLGQFITK